MKRGRKFSFLLLIMAMVITLTAFMPKTTLYAAGDDDDAQTGDNDKGGDSDTVKDTRKMVYW